MSTDNIIIRQAVPDDAAALTAYVNAVGAEELDTIPFRGGITVEGERAWIEARAREERGLILLAEHAGEIVGMVDLRVGGRRATRHAGELSMSVGRAWRGRGVGRRLLTATIDAVTRWDGFCRLELEVVPWNAAALRLYDSLGFTFEGRKRKAVDLRGKLEDSIVMALVW